MGTEVLFENHTIKEIQEIEKKLRNDIERKKEELRQMVGERYRDLMEAADTITEMKDIAESVTLRIKSIEDRCYQVQQGSLQKGILTTVEQKVLDKRKKHDLLYAVASQMKILMDAPTKIWASLENEDYLSAVCLFLLAKHTHSLLLLDPIYQEQKIFHHFPIINRQWTSINHLRYVLMKNCKQILETQDMNAKNVVGPLCCYCLLSDSTPEQILFEVLHIRKSTIQAIFKPEKYAKTQICDLVTVVQTTLKIVYLVFYPKSEEDTDCVTNLLVEALNRITSKNEPGPVDLIDLKSSETFKFLPTAVIAFRPSLKVPAVACNVELLQTKCEQWLDDINNVFQHSITDLLNYVNSVKSLSHIRKAVTDQLSQFKDWDEVCKKLLKKPLSIWDFFLKDCFLQRIKDIINGQIKSARDSCEKDIEDTMQTICHKFENSSYEYERNISLYVWIESQNDIIENIGWISQHQRNLWDSGTLSMKTFGFTPKVQSICKDVDGKLKHALEDLSFFSFDEDSGTYEAEICASTFTKQSLSGSEDRTIIYRYLSEAVEKHFFDLTSYFDAKLSSLMNEKDTFENSCRIVFLGHFCHGITKVCPHLNVCLSFSTLFQGAERSERQLSQFSKPNLTKENSLWKELRRKVMEISDSAFKLWSKHRIDNLLKNLGLELNICSAKGLLQSLLQWDKVEIQEESEQGSTVKSVLRIPQHVSFPLSNALFTFCCEINGVGGHSISSQVRSHISKQLLIGLLDIYKEKVDDEWSPEEFNPRLSQVQSLQILFDVQFLVALMVHKDYSGDHIHSTSQEIINKAIARIDPFDMDVFSVPLQQNLKRALQKSLSLFGLLASQEQVSYLNSIKAQSINSQTEHNVMLSSSGSSRFPLLPLSTRPSTTLYPGSDDNQLFDSRPKEIEVKTLQTHRSSPNLIAPDIPTNTMKSTSFYDRVTAMSSSWFGN